MQCLVTLIPYKYYLSVTMSPTITFYLEIFLFHPLMSTNFTKKSDLFSTLKVINDTGTADMQLKPNLEVRQTITLIDNLVSSKKKFFSSEGLPPFESIKPYLHKISMSVGILLSLNHQSYLYVNTTEGSSVQNSFLYLRCFCKVSWNTTKSALARS